VPLLRDEPPARKKRVGRLVHALDRPYRRSLSAVVGMLASLLFALAAYGGVIQGRAPSEQAAAVPMQTTGHGVRLRGHAVGLYPGSVQRLRVQVENSGARRVTVWAIDAEVDGATRRCSARNVSVSSYRGALRLGPHRRRSVLLTLAMRPNAADACQHARFPIAYRARVSR
jgi:hypothetical protein